MDRSGDLKRFRDIIRVRHNPISFPEDQRLYPGFIPLQVIVDAICDEIGDDSGELRVLIQELLALSLKHVSGQEDLRIDRLQQL